MRPIAGGVVDLMEFASIGKRALGVIDLMTQRQISLRPLLEPGRCDVDVTGVPKRATENTM